MRLPCHCYGVLVKGHARRRKDAAAQVGIHEVNSDRPIAHADLAECGLADVNVLAGEDICPAVAVNANCFHGFGSEICRLNGLTYCRMNCWDIALGGGSNSIRRVTRHSMNSGRTPGGAFRMRRVRFLR